MRKLFTSEEIDAISAFYKELFAATSMRDYAKQILDSGVELESIANICQFVLDSSRGIPIRKGKE